MLMSEVQFIVEKLFVDRISLLYSHLLIVHTEIIKRHNKIYKYY